MKPSGDEKAGELELECNRNSSESFMKEKIGWFFFKIRGSHNCNSKDIPTQKRSI